MELVNPNLVIDFMRYRKPVLTVSITLVILSLVSLFVPGPNFGIDFAGGTELQLAFGEGVDSAQIRSTLDDLGYEGADVVSVEGSENSYMVRVRETSALPEAQAQAIEGAITSAFGEDVVRAVSFSPGGDKVTVRLTEDIDHALLVSTIEGQDAEVRGEVNTMLGSDDVKLEVQLVGVADEVVRQLQAELGEAGPGTPERAEWIGERAGSQLRDAAVKSLFYAIIFIMIYVALRFDLRFAPGGVVAMFHDAVITLGIYVLVQKEVNLTTVAALLTILGYSINDTIVVYDRIRENMNRYREMPLRDVINLSTSQMLSRTIVTSSTTLFSVIAFFIWGTPVIKDITFALFCGILIGTFSSIYIAAPFTEWMDKRFFRPEAEENAA